MVLNLAPQHGETHGYQPEDYLDTLAEFAPEMKVDTVLADSGSVADEPRLRHAAERVGARLVLADVAHPDGSPRHDPARLAAAYSQIMGI